MMLRIACVLLLVSSVSGNVASSGTREVGVKPKFEETLPPLLMASLITAALTYPLDFGRAMAMSSAVTGQATRQLSFTKGLVPELAKGTASRAIKFGMYPIVHQALEKKSSFWKNRPTACRCAAGAIATVPEIALITPLEVTKLALQLDGVGANRFKNSLIQATKNLVKDGGGPQALYACHFGLQARQAVWTAVYFGSLPLILQQSSNLFAAGLIAGAFGALVNNPIDVCRSVAQKDLLTAWSTGTIPTVQYFPYFGRTLDAGRQVVSARGIPALWSGSAFKAAHLGFGGALMAVLQPVCTRFWTHLISLQPHTKFNQVSSTHKVTSLRGGGTFIPAGYNPFGYKLTPLGLEFIDKVHGFSDTDLGRLLASLKSSRKRLSAIKSEWLELLRFSKTAQATRIFNQLEQLLHLALKAGLID